MTFKKISFRSAHGYDTEQASNESAVSFEGEVSLTLQSDAEAADINVLMARFGLTGRMPENPRLPMFEDFTDVGDYRSALHALMGASDAFMQLPAKIRARFENDPQQLMDFVQDDKNRDEAIRIGLITEKPVAATAPPVSGAPGAAPAST